MRLIKYISLLVMIFCLLCSCIKGDCNLEIKLSPADKTLVDLSKTYDDSKLLEISQFNGTMEEFNNKYSIECIRQNDSFYRVSYLGNFSVAVIIFDDCGNKILGNIYNTTKMKSDFEGLSAGCLLDDVQKIDSKGEYPFLYSGRVDTPKLSTHYTNDGYMITINYYNDNTISGIHYDLI